MIVKLKRVVKLFHTIIGCVILTSLIPDGVFQNSEVFKLMGNNGKVLYAGTISQNKQHTKGQSLFTSTLTGDGNDSSCQSSR
ncbi:hypothetical protein BPIT_16620 [Candidatus Brocadia pituitae]|nr:hypothetical protein BPIT_16620 [Candidatus Brocadia pituitae]